MQYSLALQDAKIMGIAEGIDDSGILIRNQQCGTAVYGISTVCQDMLPECLKRAICGSGLTLRLQVEYRAA